MTKSRCFLPVLLFVPMAIFAQEGNLSTQTLVRAESKQGVVPTASTISLKVEDKVTAIADLRLVRPGQAQVALLIDDGLSRSADVQLGDLRDFIRTLPAGVELLVGYMSNGRVQVAQPFTTDRGAAVAKLRMPFGSPGQSGSPYFCLSDFVKRWPVSREGKARFVMMVTNGVDPYNGSVSITNQNSPYVQTAANDAMRAGVAVSSIYYRDAGYGDGAASLSGQGYLKLVADATGGESFYLGMGDPVSLKPFLESFVRDINETYVATFNAPAGSGGRDRLVRLKMSTSTPKLKLRHADEVRPGNVEGVE